MGARLGQCEILLRKMQKKCVISESYRNKVLDHEKITILAKKYLKKYRLKDTVDLIFHSEKISKKKIYQICLKIKNEKSS